MLVFPKAHLVVADFVVLAVEVGSVEHDAEVAEVEGYGGVGVREYTFPRLPVLAALPKVDDYEHAALGKMRKQEVGGFGPIGVGYDHVDSRRGSFGVGVPVCVAASGF